MAVQGGYSRRSISNAYIGVIIAVLVWGVSYIWENFLISSDIKIFTFMFERILLAALFSWLIVLFSGRYQKIDKKDYKWLFIIGLSEPFIYFIGETFGIKYSGSVIITSVIICTIPVFCMLAEKVFNGVTLGWLKVLGVLVTLPGVFLVVYDGGFSYGNIAGILLLSLSIVGSICYSFTVVKLVKKYSILTITAWQFTFGALLFLPTFLIWGLDGLTPQYWQKDVQLTILALASLCSTLCFYMWSNSTAKIGITKTSIFSTLIPAVSAIVAYIVGYERLTLLKVVGIAIALSGVILAQCTKSKRMSI